MKETAWNVIENVAGGGGGADAIIQTLAEEGFVVVPKEATEKMVNAGIIACIAERDHLADEGTQEIYRAMIAAASQNK